MSIGPLGLVSSAAATPAAQARSSDVERAARDATIQQRQAQSEAKAEAAAGIGQTDGEEHQTAERDADGRRLWEETPGQHPQTPSAASDPAEQRQSKDTTGDAGNHLDLTG
jgi:hypothetical protein